MRPGIILLLPALAWAQALPMAWPALPQGALLELRHPATFTGASTVASDGDWILAWCDMRDGQGRIFLKKLDPDQPGDPGAWRGGCSPLEDPGALCLPPSTITPYLPLLAPDHEGGAFVLWQDATDASHGDLLLQRVTDGPLGHGQVEWTESLRLAEDITLPVQDCRGPESRCRDWAAAWRQVVPDGQGGVWVCWRVADGALKIHHVDAQGGLLPSLPEGGLLLPLTSWSCQLTSDGQGGARMFCHQTGEAGNALAVCGLNADGSWTLPDEVRILQPADVNAFSVATLDDGRMLLAWVRPEGLRAQLLGADLQDLWPAEGILLDGPGAQNPAAAAGPGQDPVLGVAWLQGGAATVGQRLDSSGNLLWNPPASLETLPDGQASWLISLKADADGLFYMLRETDGLHVQRLEADGHGHWPLGSTPVEGPGNAGNSWALASDGQGGARVGWSHYEDLYRAQGANHRLFHRRADGTEPMDSLQATFLSETWITGGATHVVRAAGDPLCAWVTGDSLFTRSLQADTGQPNSSGDPQPIAVLPWLELAASVPTPGGAWLVTRSLRLPENMTTLHALRVDPLGQVLAGPVEVAPDLVSPSEYFDPGPVSLATHGEELVLAFEIASGTRSEIRLQSLDPLGNRLWGDSGLLATPSGETIVRLLGAAALGDGSTAFAWAPWNSTQLDFHLQAITAQGQPRFPDNGGRGLRLLLDSAPFGWDGHLQPLTDGSLLLSLTDPQPEAITRWRLCRVDPSGVVTWRHTEGSVNLMSNKVEVDEDGGLWLGRQRMDQSLLRVQVDHRNSLGDVERVWSLPRDPAENLWDWTLSHAQGDHALTLLDWSPDSLGIQVESWSLPEGDATQQWTADPPFTDGATWNVKLAPAPQGDAWLWWEERRGLDLGYGEQSRLARLDILEDTAVGSPAQRPAFHLEAAVPNPFNPRTRLAFSLDHPGPVRLELFNVTGQRVRILLRGDKPAGRHTLTLEAAGEDGHPLASGLYFVRLETADGQQIQRILLMR
jgi:hypothetical protein